MNRNPLIAAGVAALVGGGSLWLYIRRFEAEATGGPAVPILVATQDVAAGATLSKDVLGIRRVPRAYTDDRQIRATKLDEVVGVDTTLPLRANQTLLWTDIASTGPSERSLASLVLPGKRAVSLSTASNLDRLLRPGDRVDVLFTRGADAIGSETTTLTLLQNVLVLAVGPHVQREPKPRHAPIGSNANVTVSATPEQAQLLAYAQRHGELVPTLRNHEDIVIVEGLPETSAGDLVDADRRTRLSQRRAARDHTAEIDHVR